MKSPISNDNEGVYWLTDTYLKYENGMIEF